MIMDGLDTLPAQHHHHHHHHHTSAFLLTESAAAAAAQHFNVLSFDTCLYKGIGSGGSPVPGSAATAVTDLTDTAASEPQSGDLNTPVTTSGDVPSFFGPSTVVEPPPITGKHRRPGLSTPHVCRVRPAAATAAARLRVMSIRVSSSINTSSPRWIFIKSTSLPHAAARRLAH